MSQFVTLEEAKRIAKILTDDGIGGGVLPYRADRVEETVPMQAEDFRDSSGIYIPTYIGPFATPRDGDEKRFYHLRFRNGADGFNIGLVKRTMEYAPTRWPMMIAAEVAAEAR